MRGQTLAIKCYQCHVGVYVYQIGNNTKQPALCSKFDWSEDYIVDCPFSTMCLKKVHKYVLNDNGDTIETVLRDCASQKYRDQVFRQGGWQEEHRIEEPYQEGCEELIPSEKATISTYCHCRGNLCNSATKESNGLHTDAMAVIFVYNALKYLNSGLIRY
ncbi:uncharacterized protein LOC129609574 isoform X2 [Condylostylus longicornis]|uniref:uncharacterized protein LOC129609574 isoform X2 n=1 Tax=Condylostylus longicornis TaxID=2530218 RepID=UPI00244DE41E|nr:uncharacterized protein LOC129609574 isoform X2 [Condylostylus longicornis]